MSIDLGSAHGRITIDTAGVEQAVKKAQSALVTFHDKGLKGMAAMAIGAGAANLAFDAVAKSLQYAKQAAEAAWRTFEEGAGLEAARGRFEKLAESIDTTSESLLTKLRAATNGMMTDAALMASATDIMSLGLGKTEEQTVRLASVAGKLGWDMQQVVMTMANNSKLRLDALGLSLDDVNARVAKLREGGMSLDEAFDLAVIEAGEAKIELLGDTSLTTAGKITQLKVSLGNAQDAFAATFAAELADEFTEVAGSSQDMAEGLTATAESLGYMSAAAVAAGRHLPQVTERVMNALDMGWLLRVKEVALLAGVTIGRQEAAESAAMDRMAARRDAHYRMQVAGSEAEQKLADDAERRQRVEEVAAEEQVEAAARAERMYSEFGHATDAVNRQLQAYAYRGEVAANTNRRIAEETGYTVYELAQMGKTAEEVMEETAAAIEATAARAAAAFASVQGDYVTPLPGADEPLVTPERTVSIVTQVSGPTEEQRALAERYREEIEKLQGTYNELVAGVGTYGMEQEALTQRITETAYEIAHYEGLLAGIPAAVNEVATSQQGLSVNVDAARQAIYDQLVDMEAAPEIVAAYAAATGIMSAAQAEAVLQAAAVKVKIDELAASIAAGMPIDQALADLDAFITKIETGVNPATETLATDVPQRVTDMKDAMGAEALAAGEAVPANIASGITDNLEGATTAATNAAEAITQAVRDAHGIESPSSVFAEIGEQDIAGWVEGVDGRLDDAVEAMERVTEAVVAAWDDTISNMEIVGESMMDGVIVGVERRRGELAAKMKEIADDTFNQTMDAIMAESPSRLYMQVGDAIIAGVEVGVERRRAELLRQLDRLGEDMKDQRDRLLKELADLDVLGTLEGLTGNASGLYRIGQQVFKLQAEALEEDISETSDQLTAVFDGLRQTFGDNVVDNLLGMSAGERAYFVRSLRGSSAYENNVEIRQRLDEAVRLADERNRLEEEYIRQQEELARLEEQRAQLDFLKTQVDLLELVRENNLGTDILDGLTLGLEGSMTDILAAMTEATRRLIERANEELEIASPSAVFERIGERVMQGMAQGIGRAREAQAQMRESLRRLTAVGVADVQQLQARLSAAAQPAAAAAAVAPSQSVYIYGGYNPVVPNGNTADPLREMFYQGLLYQGRG